MGATYIIDTEVRLAELEELTKQAWFQYNETLRGLEGAEYEEAEHTAWNRLKTTLSELETERARLMAPTEA